MDNNAVKITQAKELRGAIVLQLYDVYGERTALSDVCDAGVILDE